MWLFVLVANADRAPGLLPELARAAGDARVQIHPAILSRPDVEALIAASDAYVSLHRAEGFGLPLAESMAMGKPVIATDYSGSIDYLDESTGFPVRWRTMMLARALRDYDAGTPWAQPDEDHAVERLRSVFSNPDEARCRGEAARRRIAERYDPGVIGRQVASRLVELRGRLEATA
jgi:glycosyltransferase involved in cell wall biosynthesis